MDKPHSDSRKLIDLVSILVEASPRGRGAALALQRIGGQAKYHAINQQISKPDLYPEEPHCAPLLCLACA